MILKMTTLILAVCVNFFITAKAAGDEKLEESRLKTAARVSAISNPPTTEELLNLFRGSSSPGPQKISNTLIWIIQLQEAFRNGVSHFQKKWTEYSKYYNDNPKTMCEINIGEENRNISGSRTRVQWLIIYDHTTNQTLENIETEKNTLKLLFPLNRSGTT